MAAADEKAQAQQHQQKTDEKQAREAGIVIPHNWPHDADGRPMAIVTAQASELVPTAQFANVTLGPVGVMRPVPNYDNPDLLANEMRMVSLMCQWNIGVERRLLDWSRDPSTKIEMPTLAEMTGTSFGEFFERLAGAASAS